MGKDIRISREHHSDKHGDHRDVMEKSSDSGKWEKVDHVPSDEQSVPVRNDNEK